MDTIYRKLLTYSYNIVGSYENARDLVQDVIEKYIGLNKSHIENETNYLIKSVINHSINFKNKHSKKSAYGVWLPQPVETESPDIKLIKEQTANFSLLVIMENLNPKERAVFILKETFDYTHEEISTVLDITIAHSRQLLTRAKKTLKGISFKTPYPQKNILKKYIDAIVHADINTLEKLLIQDIRLMADGGNKVRVIKDMEIGKQATARLLQHVYGLFLADKRYTFTIVNHQPAICFWKKDIVYNCHVISVGKSGQIDNIYSIVDPNKLTSLSKKRAF